ncbi:MAG TPA: diguanylate cyclase [Burkholderiaceae bacterium]
MTESAPPDPGPSALLDEVRLLLQSMDMGRALELARKALDTASTPAEHIAARYWLARCHYVAGDIDIAITLAADTGDAAVQAQETTWLARAHTLEARCLELAGEPEAALDLALAALNELESAGLQDDESRSARQAAAISLAVIYLRLADLSSAMQWCERGQALAAALMDEPALAAATDTVACIHAATAAKARDAGDLVEAERCERLAIDCSRRAVDLASRLGHVDYETSALLNLAESLTLVGEASSALDLLQDWGRRHPDAMPRQWAHQLDSLGTVYLALDRPEDAIGAFEQSLGRCPSTAYRTLVTEHLSTALERCGRWREALDRYKEFHALQARVSAERAQRNARVAAARLDIGRERAKSRQLATSNQRLRRRAEDLVRQANEDALTGLPNRRHVDALLGNWPRPISVALIDVDHFKQVNDRFSHAVGDDVLRKLASIMRTNCRPREVPARLGGEEFVLIIESAQESDIERVAERLRAAVEAFAWESISIGLRVTISVGVARASEVADGPELLTVADRRLYAAKREGRNRVVLTG